MDMIGKMLKEFGNDIDFVFRETSKSKFEKFENKLFNSWL